MSGPLYRAEILGLLLFLPWFVCGQLFENFTSSVDNVTSAGPVQDKQSTKPTPSLAEQTTSLSKPTSASPQPFLRNDCRQQLMVCGGLIIACTFFLLTTFLLTCKVCRLSRRVRKLSRSFEPHSDCDFSEAKKGKSKSGTEAKETAVLMSDVTQTNQEPDGAATKQDGRKSEGDASKSEEASPPDAAAESSPSEPEGEASSSETPPAAAAAAPSAPSSKGTEEPKNQP